VGVQVHGPSSCSSNVAAPAAAGATGAAVAGDAGVTEKQHKQLTGCKLQDASKQLCGWHAAVTAAICAAACQVPPLGTADA
jgi:hypothetical protein